MKPIALIPARGGSKRIPEKNVKTLGGHPLLAYAITSALESAMFDAVYVSSDSKDILGQAAKYGAQTILRPEKFATDTSPDIEWITHAFSAIKLPYSAFAILRPTSPFRTAETIRRAVSVFEACQPCDSIRAVERTKQTPWKMWFRSADHDALIPLSEMLRSAGFQSHYLCGDSNDPFLVPRHSCPTQLHPQILAQNASLEISWVRNVTEKRSISGDIIKPFYTVGREGMDLNTEDDWMLAEVLIEKGLAKLPRIPEC